MSMQAHLAELEKSTRHSKPNSLNALAHPSVDDITIAELKRRKLHVKDEIARLKHQRKRKCPLTGSSPSEVSAADAASASLFPTPPRSVGRRYVGATKPSAGKGRT